MYDDEESASGSGDDENLHNSLSRRGGAQCTRQLGPRRETKCVSGVLMLQRRCCAVHARDHGVLVRLRRLRWAGQLVSRPRMGRVHDFALHLRGMQRGEQRWGFEV